jgi:hypothetical protein
MRIIPKLLALLMVAIPLISQPGVRNYTALKTTSLTAAAEKVTIQQTTGARTVRFTTATIYCSVACSPTVSQNGTAATATTLTITPLNNAPTSTTTAFSSSDAGSGTTLGVYNIPAGGTLTLDISQIFLASGAPTSTNFSIGTDTITGTARIQIKWTE